MGSGAAPAARRSPQWDIGMADPAARGVLRYPEKRPAAGSRSAILETGLSRKKSYPMDILFVFF
jgi:hypothetical protein